MKAFVQKEHVECLGFLLVFKALLEAGILVF